MKGPGQRLAQGSKREKELKTLKMLHQRHCENVYQIHNPKTYPKEYPKDSKTAFTPTPNIEKPIFEKPARNGSSRGYI